MSRNRSKGKKHPLLRVAQSITDGKLVDWEEEKEINARDNGAIRRQLRHLRLIESVARAYQTPASGEVDSTEAPTVDVAASGAEDRSGPPLPHETPPPSWGPLKILEQVGRGGFGEVYRAFDPTLQREVALKLLRPERSRNRDATDEFIQEARRQAKIKHPNILQIFGVDEHEGRVGLWTEFLQGENLEEILSRQGPFGAEEAASIGISLCGALAAIHRAGMVHRDVKTFNVMREQGGRIVLMDFGSVQDFSRVGQPVDPLKSSGTPLYMSPDQLIHGEAPKPSSDTYALGVLLYRLVSGRLPVEATTFPELMEKHRKGERTPLRDHRPELTSEFIQVVERALEADPARRYPSAGAMEKALAESVRAPIPGPDTVTPPEPKPMTPPKPVWRRTPIMASIVTAAALIVLFAAWWFWPPPASGPPFTAEAALYRMREKVEERLLPGSRVAPGDGLFMEVTGDEEMYVYVLNADEKGEIWMLFPAGLDLDNPLVPGEKHRLPGKRDDGEEMNWEVTSAGGRESILVIASRTPLADLEKDLEGVERAREGREVTYAPVHPESLYRFRGISGLSPIPPRKPEHPGTLLSDIHRDLSATSQANRGIWSWTIQLENPAR